MLASTDSAAVALHTAMLQDEFPEAYRFAISVFPSEDDDVITSPYNAMLSLAELTEHADAVFPLENQALMDMCSLVQARSGPANSQPSSLLTGPTTGNSPSTPLRRFKQRLDHCLPSIGTPQLPAGKKHPLQVRVDIALLLACTVQVRQAPRILQTTADRLHAVGDGTRVLHSMSTIRK